MTMHNPISGNNTGLPAKSRRTPPKGLLTSTEWAEVHDALTLALNALGEGPGDVDRGFLVNCVLNQRVAIKITHNRMQKLDGLKGEV